MSGVLTLRLCSSKLRLLVGDDVTVVVAAAVVVVVFAVPNRRVGSCLM